MPSPLWGLTSSLTHRPVSGSDIICIGPNPLLADIILFGFSLSGFPSTFFFSFSSPTHVGSHNPPRLGPSVLAGTHSFLQLMWDSPLANPPPFGVQRPYWHTASVYPLWETVSSLAHRPEPGSDTICNGPNSSLADIILFGLFLSGFPLTFFFFILLPNRCGISQSTPIQGPTSSLTLILFSNRCGTPTKSTSLRGPASLLAHHLVSALFGEQPLRWHIAGNLL